MTVLLWYRRRSGVSYRSIFADRSRSIEETEKLLAIRDGTTNASNIIHYCAY